MSNPLIRCFVLLAMILGPAVFAPVAGAAGDAFGGMYRLHAYGSIVAPGSLGFEQKEF